MYHLQSRYYNPKIGRFINADVFISTGQGLLGNNMFAYCGNNPINSSDPNGMCSFGLRNGISKQIAVTRACDCGGASCGKTDLTGITVTYGFTISFSLGSVVFCGQIGLSMDGEGNAELQGAYGDGFSTGTVGGSFMSFVTVTNAPTVFSLHGMGCQTGGICSGGLGVGLDVNIIPNPAGGEDYAGCTLSGGVATPDVHVIMEYAFPIISVSAKMIEIFNNACYATIKG